MTKFLILRFSSIGDIVLTSPVVRCLKIQYHNAEIHFACKKVNGIILANNPYIDKLHFLEDNLKVLIQELRRENFDYIIDLHNNLRTKIIKLCLSKPSFSFDKYNIEKFLYTQFKINRLPALHIVDRYLDTLNSFNIKNDGQGLDYFIPAKDELTLEEYNIPEKYMAFVLGGKFATKQMPKEKLMAICKQLPGYTVLLGGPEDSDLGKEIHQMLPNKTYNACGFFNLNQSASLIKQAHQVITHDTGLMHIAAAFQKNIITVWGNTSPIFGMSAYVSTEKRVEVQVPDLACRPCSKIGYNKCPKKHFKCMNDINIQEILSVVQV